MKQITLFTILLSVASNYAMEQTIPPITPEQFKPKLLGSVHEHRGGKRELSCVIYRKQHEEDTARYTVYTLRGINMAGSIECKLEVAITENKNMSPVLRVIHSKSNTVELPQFAVGTYTVSNAFYPMLEEKLALQK